MIDEIASAPDRYHTRARTLCSGAARSYSSWPHSTIEPVKHADRPSVSRGPRGLEHLTSPLAVPLGTYPYPHPKTLEPYFIGVLASDQDEQPCEPRPHGKGCPSGTSAPTAFQGAINHLIVIKRNTIENNGGIEVPAQAAARTPSDLARGVGCERGHVREGGVTPGVWEWGRGKGAADEYPHTLCLLSCTCSCGRRG